MLEEVAREAIARTCALLWDRGLVAGASGNVSARLDDGTIVVTPTALSLREVDPADLVRVAADGRPLDGHRRPTSELALHLAAYRVRPDVACVVHTHPTHCTGWSKTGGLFDLDTVGASESLGPIAFTQYARPGSQELAARCAEAFAGGADTVVMERHGLSTVGPSLAVAFDRSDLAEQTAHIEFVARLLATAGARD
jgi:ribulose-5-phosphate 4-epimerase/fuculose-1-phosphate aldolase